MPASQVLEVAGTGMVDHIPVIWRMPGHRHDGAPLALWLPALGMTKEWVAPFLDDLAAAGFAAISFDLWEHGQRGAESADELRNRVFGSYRRYKWPILGHTALDALRVIDWAAGALDARTAVVAGGISLGGEAAVTVAGIDPRVTHVAAIVASPDWTSPGMHGFDDPGRLLPQGEPDSYARWFYDHLDPMTHLDRYARGPAIAFECGQADAHVPADGALRFKDALTAAHPGAGGRVRVTVHPGIGHLDGVRSPQLHSRCLEWFTTRAPGHG